MGMRREEFVGSTGPALKPSGSRALLHEADPSGLLGVDTFRADSITPYKYIYAATIAHSIVNYINIQSTSN